MTSDVSFYPEGIELPFDDTRDFDASERGLIDRGPAQIFNDKGDVVWDAGSYDFITGEAPATVHPSLWRQSTLVARRGLFEVIEGIYQVRGFDLSNVTFVETNSGVIVIDPLISAETAAAAWDLYKEHRGDKPVKAVIYSHCHVDHFGGVKGIVSQEQVDAGEVAVIAPEGFVEHAIAENVYAGVAMGRRAGYMYGAALARDPRGGVGAGLGQTSSQGAVTLISPTDYITTTGEERTIDGVQIVFQMAPGTEAPSEMHFYFPGLRALCMAENSTHTLHNLLTLRGAVVRDPHIWAHYLTEAIGLFGSKSDVAFASHHWPTWGREEIIEFLSLQRDLYAYLHDQTLRLLNKGFVGSEIAEDFALPPALEAVWHTHGYYGSVSHNVKAIYQRYMGWYEGNPARLWQHPPQAAGTRYVAAMGGSDAVVAIAREAHGSGDDRWAAELLDHVIFAEPSHSAARALQADVLETLGFGAENGTWRSAYLSGAMELRSGNFGTPTVAASADVIAHLSPSLFFDALAIQVNGPKAWDLSVALAWNFPDHGENYRTELRNGVLISIMDGSGDADATLTVPGTALAHLAGGDMEGASSAGLTIDGDQGALGKVFGVLDPGDPAFNIIEP